MSHDDYNCNVDSNSEFKWEVHRKTMIINRYDCSAVAIDDNRMIITGGEYSFSGDERVLSTAELFDSSKRDSIHKKLADMKQKRRIHASIVHGDYVYAIGGDNGKRYLRCVEKLNIKNLTNSVWERVAPMKEQRSYFAVAKDDDYIYAFGGECRKGRSERYNVRKNKWENIPPMKYWRTAHAAIKVGTKVFVFGGIAGLCEKCDKYDQNDECECDLYPLEIEIFDTLSQNWEDGTRIKVPFELSRIVALLVDDRIIVLGGYGRNNTLMNQSIYIFDPKEYTWMKFNQTAMNVTRIGFGAVLLKQNTIYAVGGSDKNEKTLDTIEYGIVHKILLASDRKRSKTNGKQLLGVNEKSRKQSKESGEQLVYDTNQSQVETSANIELEDESKNETAVNHMESRRRIATSTNQNTIPPKCSSLKSPLKRFALQEGSAEKRLKEAFDGNEQFGNQSGEATNQSTYNENQIQRVNSDNMNVEEGSNEHETTLNDMESTAREVTYTSTNCYSTPQKYPPSRAAFERLTLLEEKVEKLWKASRKNSRSLSEERANQSTLDTNQAQVETSVNIKVEEDETIMNDLESATRTVSSTNPNSTPPTYSSSKTALERLALLEESIGVKNNSSNLPRRIETLEELILSRMSRGDETIVERIQKLEKNFY